MAEPTLVRDAQSAPPASPRARAQDILALFSEALNEFGRHDGPWLAGGIAYYAAFSVFPLLLVLLAAFGFLLRFSPGARDAQSQLLGVLAQNTTPQLASQVAAVLAGVKLDAIISGPLGMIALLLGATGLFAALQGAFDRLWDVPVPSPGILPQVRLLLRQRLNAFLMLIAVGLLVIVAFAGGFALTAIGALAARLPGGSFGWQIARVGISVVVNSVVLAIVYRVPPRPDVGWADVWFAAVFVAIVWEIGRQVLAFLVIGQNFSAYGVIGAFIAVLSWIYYASLLFFVGAELVRVNCRRREMAWAPALEEQHESKTAHGEPVPGSGSGRAPGEVLGRAPREAGAGAVSTMKSGGVMKTAFGLAKETFKSWSEDKAARLAAALAYYTVFSIAPLLIVVIGIAGLVFGQQAVQGQIVDQIQGMVGAEGATLIQNMIASASKPATGIVATVIGLGMLFLGAAGVFGQLQDSLNTIWEVAPRPGRPITAVLKDRLLTFGMVFGVGFLLMVSLVVSAVLAALTGTLSGLLPVGTPWLWQSANNLVSFLVITVLFAIMFKYLPDVHIRWRDVWIGAAVTALLFTIGKYLIGLYLGRTSAGSAYGAAGSLVVILLWIYYSAQIMFLGAEFTQVYARRYGARIEPARDAIAVTEEIRAEQGIPHTDEVKQRASGAERLTPRVEEEAGAGLPQTQAEGPTHTVAGGSGNAPSRGYVFAARSLPPKDPGSGAKAAAATLAAAALFAVVAATRLFRRH